MIYVIISYDPLTAFDIVFYTRYSIAVKYLLILLLEVGAVLIFQIYLLIRKFPVNSNI